MSSSHSFGHSEDAALETLFLPLGSGDIIWPSTRRVLFMRARAGVPLYRFPLVDIVCEQSFRPFADALMRGGLNVTSTDDEKFPLVLLLLPRQRDELRALLARAVLRATPDGTVVASALNTEGARSAEADLKRLIGSVHSLSKNKCRVFWSDTKQRKRDDTLIEAWAMLDAPRQIDEGRFLSRPGLFAWDRIDAASALLANCLPHGLHGRGADIGAGFGYLSAQILARCPKVNAVDLYEAEARALDLARVNLAQQCTDVALDFLWHDVTTGLPRRYDFIVSNPPFHLGRADQPGLGHAFISAAATALLPGGRFLMVANRHLPYENLLRDRFASVHVLTEAQGYKVITAVKADT